MPALEDRAFLLLITAVSVAFAWIVWPFYGAVLWGAAIAIVFAPLQRRLRARMRNRRTLAASTTLVLIVLIVIVPLILVGALLVRQAASVYERIESGELDFQVLLLRVADALPAWVVGLLRRVGVSDLGDLEEQLAAGIQAASQFLAQQLVDFGQNTFDFVVGLFVMVYLLFFLLRDGDVLARRITDAIPLRAEQLSALITRFTVVIRAMIKGTLAVAVAQGVLGGVIFGLLGIPASALWGVVMGILSLLPVVGAPLVWLPAGVYLLASGEVWQGLTLLAYGLLVISLIDNVLRPILVGKDTRIPDYVVLISTLGGLAIFGANGLLLGPVIAALFLSAWDIFAESKGNLR